jgi:hypothetical protein
MLCSDQMAAQIEWILNCGMGMLDTVKLAHPGFSIALVDLHLISPTNHLSTRRTRRQVMSCKSLSVLGWRRVRQVRRV